MNAIIAATLVYVLGVISGRWAAHKIDGILGYEEGFNTGCQVGWIACNRGQGPDARSYSRPADDEESLF